MAEAAFSVDGKYYSAITQDGRLRIWDTETNVLKQEYTPDLHLTSPPSCLQWISATQSANTPKGGRRKSVSEETHHIALGTTSGKILIYSVAQAKVETVLSNENSHSGITSLDWHAKYGLYSCSKENSLCEWDLQSSLIRYKYNVSIESKSKHGNIRAIKIVPHKQNTAARYLVAASYQVMLWRLHDGEATIIKNLGHNAAPTALLSIATLNDVCWLIEGSQNERLLSFWDVTITDEHVPQMNGDETPHKKQRRKSISKAPTTTATPTYNFVLEDAPRLVDVELKNEDGATKLSLAAATRSGVVHYYGLMLNGSSTKPIKPSVTIQVTSADARPLPLQCCRLPPTGELLLGYWNGPVMTFERVKPDLKTKTQILIRGEKEPKKKGKQDAKKVRENDTSQVTYVEPLGASQGNEPRPEIRSVKVEVPMEARLANLALDVKGRSKSAVSQNLTKLLMQGLIPRTKVLQKDDPMVALRTVSNLPADYVPQLLEQLADMATRKTSQCASVCTWLSAVVRCHSALLLATMGSRSSDHLTQLLAIFTNRRSHLCQLLNLKGRLDLTISQRSASDIAHEEQQPVLNYNDSSSDEEMEAEPYQSDSDASWGDDKFESDASAQDEADSDND
ncbi:hypothetical protein HW555_011709 [Spodoptera exigua]|uniref:Small-subunit processome Utp12 domain-containing protein n=1 Tax=Spodoptera exigua TaxID=7107 RepID=A0A835KZQ3_SPOEX|nr:hypothetical protein HW555_011709 [Spodoptera exigua]